MTKIFALIAGLVLIGFPAWWLRESTVPLPAYRKGGFTDYVRSWPSMAASFSASPCKLIAQND